MQQPIPSDRCPKCGGPLVRGERFLRCVICGYTKPTGYYLVKVWWPLVNRIDILYSSRYEAERDGKDFVEVKGATTAIVEEIIG